MVLKTFNLKIVLRVTLKIFLFFYPFPLFSQEKKESLTLFTPCMLINKDNLSIQQKYSFIEDVKLNKSGNVSESPPIGNVCFQKISIPPPRMVLPIRPPPHPLGISVPEGSCLTPHPPGISYFLFHGLTLPHLEIFDHVPLKINCSHHKTQFL